MARKPTMNDVARTAGVGTMTVSRVLNSAEHVSEATAARVHRAVAQLGYRPNEMARALRNSKSRTIGLLLPNLHDPFYATCAHALNMVANAHDYTVLLTLTNDDSNREYQEAQRMLQRRVEGMVVIPAGSAVCRLGEEEFRDVPLVMLDRPLQAKGASEADSVLTENEQGARLAADHLLQVHGFRAFCFWATAPVCTPWSGAGPAMRPPCAARDAGPGVTSTAPPKKTPGRCCSARSISQTRRKRFFSGNNLTTRHILSALLRLRCRVPEDIALVGFDDLELGDLLHPALTVVRQPAEELGQTAGRLLFAKMKKQVPLRAVSQVVLPVELLVRHSCGCPYERGAPTRETLPS